MGVLAQDPLQGLGDLGDDLGLLFAGDAVAGDADVDEWHLEFILVERMGALAKGYRPADCNCICSASPDLCRIGNFSYYPV
ncbi:hypothetical protein thsps21_35430 [Pseudomonas sp. No.21]|nr:hypothetical protein TUM20249_17620 [Pseudomonas tohonis]